MLLLSFYSKLDWVQYIISIAKTASRKIGALIRSMEFLSTEVALYLYKSTVVMSGLVLLLATWNFYKNCKCGYVQLHIQNYFGQTGTYIEQWQTRVAKLSKFVPYALKMHSLVPSVLRLPCKTFSELLKFALRNSFL